VFCEEARRQKVEGAHDLSSMLSRCGDWRLAIGDWRPAISCPSLFKWAWA